MKSLNPAKGLIIGLVLAAVCYFFVFDSSSLLTSQLNNIKGENKQLTNELNKLKRSISEAQKYQRTKEELGETINKIVKFIPQDLNESKMTIKLTSAANKVGINILGVEKGQSSNQRIKNNLYQEISVGIRLQGSFGQIMQFLSVLTDQDNIISIKRFDLTKARSDSGGGLINFSSTFVGYKYMEKTNNEPEFN